MTKDEIIAMAREAGFDMSNLPSIRASNVYGEVNDELERFAALVAAKAAADERAACAQVCDRFDTGRRLTSDFKAQEMAAAIRAMGDQS